MIFLENIIDKYISIPDSPQFLVLDFIERWHLVSIVRMNQVHLEYQSTSFQ